jgi:putative transposase
LRKPENFPWSGHRAYLGLEVIPQLKTDWVLSMFSSNVKRVQRSYQTFIEERKGWGHQGELGRESEIDFRVLGGEIFIDKVFGQSHEGLKRKVPVEEIVSCVCQKFSLKEQRLLRSGKERRLYKVRAIAAWLVLDSGYLTLAGLSKSVNRDSSTLSTSVKDLERRVQTDIQLAQLMGNIREELHKIPLSKARHRKLTSVFENMLQCYLFLQSDIVEHKLLDHFLFLSRRLIKRSHTEWALQQKLFP